MDYFSLFQIPQKFHINKNLLEKKFYSLQKKYHPDIYKKKNHNKNDYPISSSKINKAYNILKDKFNRAKYLLKIYNGNKIKKKKILTQDSLNKQFKLYEIIEKFKKKKEDIKNIDIFIKKIKNKIRYYFFKINQEFKLKKICEAQETLYNLFFKKKILLILKEIKDDYVK
ncbi:Fe-S protein assembly co-chaperone HscB [Buchnera aphidicola]|uniref:Fe-S protein assembly co-chaperone HscB n=1 Tax=Buchnera aphidicola TaxID=9 RepID=UPI00094C6C2E|nr:Fe-S protein assembly co-chaperone HscB [Buchnera aphidicola]